MNSSSTEPPPRFPPSDPNGGGVLGQIVLHERPFCDEIFSRESLQKGRWLVENGAVRVVTANVQGRFAGIFGQIADDEDGPRAEVSIVIHRSDEGWKVDGRSDRSTEANDAHVAALLMAAMREKGAVADLSFGLGQLRSGIHLFSVDVRAGILHWDDSDARAVLENMPLARLDGEDPKVETRLRAMGLKRLVELYPWDEIVPEYRQCYAYSAIRRGMQEVFWADFLSNRRGELEALDCEITIDPDFGLQVIEPLDYYGEIHAEEEAVDWFGFEYGMRRGEEKINLLPCLVRYLESKPAGFRLANLGKGAEEKKIPIQLGDTGQFVAIPARKLQTILGLLTELFDLQPISEEGTVRLHHVRAAQLTRFQGEEALVDTAPEDLRKRAAEIEALRPKENPEAPQGFLASLRPYQQDGFEWLQFLREQRLGGILADDMGLGKTVQTLCHLHCEKVNGRADLPSLILAPKSVVPNWEKEAKKFAPSLKVIALQGPQRKKYYPVLQHCDLVVTSYPVLFRDAEELLNQPFHYVVLDEAHTIKNTASQITKVAYQIDARHRLCLSGTPIENHLGELWSLFHFLTPGFLGSEESFNRCFRIPIEKHRDEGLRKRLAERVAPLMLRRTKTLVAHDLPPKTEIVRTVELHPKQVELYEAVRAAVSREVHEEIARLGAEKSKLLVLDALLKLRQVCNHPHLLQLPSARKVKRSAKMDLIMDWIPSMVKEGRRILVFSQFTGMLSIIEQALTKEGVRFLTLTGQSKDRGQLCDDFQAGKAPVFLISLRAGGTGLNLTAADTVIHFDPWWNPALESQATDRAYRIGQKNPVFVYKLITAGTIEEKILLLQQKKRALFEGILEGTPQKLSFSEDELDDLLAPMK
ncbi:MAG: DEAD/DEAH box helicase [Verrucomicrobiaceae bacterium]|nr:DEAD/DEAH box helicase [Verrucomicrobiaceae bacterium]